MSAALTPVWNFRKAKNRLAVEAPDKVSDPEAAVRERAPRTSEGRTEGLKGSTGCVAIPVSDWPNPLGGGGFLSNIAAFAPARSGDMCCLPTG